MIRKAINEPDDSPPGAWRAALAPAATCAACRQHVCAHNDLEYQGLVRLKGHDDD